MKHLSNTKIIHGMVKAVDRHPCYWSISYKLYRTLICGEPFQVNRGNGNTYAPTAICTYVRIDAPDSSMYEVTFFGEYSSILPCDDLNIIVHQNHDGSYNAKSALNTKTNRQLKPDLWCLPATLLRGIILFVLLSIVMVIIMIVSGLPTLISIFKEMGVYIIAAIIIIPAISGGGKNE